MILRQRILPLTVAVAVVSAATATGCAARIEQPSESSAGSPSPSNSTPSTNSFVGISTELASKLDESDNNNVFWTSPDGGHGLSEALAPVYNPSLLRMNNGFIAPTDGGLVVFDGNLQVTQQLPVPEIGIGTMAGSSNSPDGSHGVFAFYSGDAQSDEPDARLIVLASENSVDAVHSPNLVQAVTSCDDGTARWIEYRPDSNSDPLGPGKAYLASWTPGEDIVSSAIDADFEVAPSAESSLSCDSSNSFVDSPNRAGDRSVIQITTEDDGRPEIQSTQGLPAFPTANGSRFTHTEGVMLYTLSSNGELSKVDYSRGEVLYSERLDVSGPDILSATYEDESVYIVTRPDQSDNRQSVQRVSLENPSCISDRVTLEAYDTQSEESQKKRGESSYLAVQSILPLRKENQVACVTSA